MPELPEVETIASGLRPHLVGKSIQTCHLLSPKLRYPLDPTLPQRLQGQVIQEITRRGKTLIMTLNQGGVLWHMGMTGVLRLFAQPHPQPQRHVHVTWELGDLALHYHDVRRFGYLLWSDHPHQHPSLQALGPEPLGSDFNGQGLWQRAHTSARPIKQILMDPRVVVGVGNIYANEALFAAGIHPQQPGNTLTPKACQCLATSIQSVLREAIAKGGTTLNDFMSVDGKPGYFTQALQIYGRHNLPCQVCQTPVQRWMLANRATFACPTCQPMDEERQIR